MILEFIEDCFYASKEYLPSSSFVSSGVVDGDGQLVSSKPYSVNDVIVFIRGIIFCQEKFRKRMSILSCFRKMELALEYLTSPFTPAMAPSLLMSRS